MIGGAMDEIRTEKNTEFNYRLLPLEKPVLFIQIMPASFFHVYYMLTASVV
jgi:hypothetical protein